MHFHAPPMGTLVKLMCLVALIFMCAHNFFAFVRPCKREREREREFVCVLKMFVRECVFVCTRVCLSACLFVLNNDRIE